MKKKWIITIVTLLAVLVMFFSLFKLMNSRTYQVFGDLTYKIDTDEKVAALTFDDGPSKNTGEILKLLDQYDVKATFYLIGQDMEQHPDELKDIIAAGHQVGNHTYSHKRNVFKSPQFIQNEIKKTNDLIREAGYEEKITFRPPYGKKLFSLPYYVNKENMHTVTWNIEPDTYANTPEEKIAYVKENLAPGSIILVHPMYDSNELETIEGIITSLHEEGYRFVTVDELLGN